MSEKESRIKEEDIKLWDEEAAYDEHIHPLVMQLQAACKEHKIPMFFLASFRRVPEGEQVACCALLGVDDRHSQALTNAYRISDKKERDEFIRELGLLRVLDVLEDLKGL